ncbi:hypothetical protein UMM65_13890 [Aureibaculum sp. 2210JD6-5]|uniref:hypothetical protein n=1 Tax=Aureibaculum sp. 2210JD6-5 TaxID=3103957 RepID=UPI002AAEE357|nr:hypothetical protein [Aureibaculum sp. 2210JD6-5]MDY7396338.1 hypothetical protein [Aureibaculum sp. 2210JD6-5]
MRELEIKDKQRYLTESYPFAEVPELADRKKCIHCDSSIIVGNYKVFTNELGEELIYCPNAPECDGTVIDWIDI